jgi:hypothetical protein
MVRYRDANNATLRRTFETKQDALDFKAAVRTDVRRGVYRDDRKALTPFATVAEDWYRTAELSRGWSPKTAAGYRSILDAHLLPAFGQRAIDVLRSRVTVERSMSDVRGSAALWADQDGESPGRRRPALHHEAARGADVRKGPR